MSRGKFITLEGIDGAGKSTHIGAIADFLRGHGKDLVVTREPGGTPLGEKLRSVLLSQTMHIETEALLMFAARREHIAQVIAPALAAGRWVLRRKPTVSSARAGVSSSGSGQAISSARPRSRAGCGSWTAASLWLKSKKKSKRSFQPSVDRHV